MSSDESVRARWQRRGAVVLAVLVFWGVAYVIGRTSDRSEPAAAPAPSAGPQLESAALPSASAPAPAETPLTELLQLPGAVPVKGTGKFTYASADGPVLGEKGELRRFRVAVEKGSKEDAEEFAEQVGATLANPLGWTGGGTLRLQQVASKDDADFTIYLATRRTVGSMCEGAGSDVRVKGVPYTSCHTDGRVIINLDRWRLSATPYVNAKVSLAAYREFVINHEVGHELGHSHQGCPEKGGPAPVMVEQTLKLRGCVPYSWPREGDDWLEGSPL